MPRRHEGEGQNGDSQTGPADDPQQAARPGVLGVLGPGGQQDEAQHTAGDGAAEVSIVVGRRAHGRAERKERRHEQAQGDPPQPLGVPVHGRVKAAHQEHGQQAHDRARRADRDHHPVFSSSEPSEPPRPETTNVAASQERPTTRSSVIAAKAMTTALPTMCARLACSSGAVKIRHHSPLLDHQVAAHPADGHQVVEAHLHARPHRQAGGRLEDEDQRQQGQQTDAQIGRLVEAASRRWPRTTATPRARPAPRRRSWRAARPRDGRRWTRRASAPDSNSTGRMPAKPSRLVNGFGY
jgi:hypothetical protein